MYSKRLSALPKVIPKWEIESRLQSNSKINVFSSDLKTKFFDALTESEVKFSMFKLAHFSMSFCPFSGMVQTFFSCFD